LIFISLAVEVPSHSASNGFLSAAVPLIDLWDVGPIALGKFEERRVRVVAFAFAVAVFMLAILRTAVLPH
jgi:hypothetical protein